ncbi:MAG: hypothetical protein KAW56_13735, partial [Candidatus Marinimicrobia bacterium]|nr:hypothetical protein [Candidatus Neomarinimicrobiota bacterium]
IDLEAGDFITIVDTDLNINKMTRIVELTKSLANEYKYTLKLSDHLEVQLLQQLYEDQEDLHEIIDIGEGGDIYRSWRNWRTSEELRTMVFDTDGYFDMGKIRPESVETMMLSVGAKSSQFILKNVEIEANYLSLPSKFRASAGELIHLSIDEEIRTWTLSSNTQDSLVDATAYYIYAKCTKEPGYTGQIVVDETQRKFDDDATYYYFLIGVLHSVIDGIRGVSLTYGQTIINGRFIRTGKIESTDGLTYFDLDNSEIRGNIKFSAGMYYAKTFRQATAPTEDMVEGDFWIDTDDGDKTYTYNGSIWVQAYTIINGGNIEAGSLSLVAAASDFNWSSLDDDGNKPDDDADVTGSNTAADIINLPATPAGAGLYATGSYLGYYDSASWKAYIQSNGNFYFGGDVNNYIQWNGSSLVLKGSVTLVNTIPNAKVDGLGNLALEDSLAYGDITGTKPPSNADVTLTAIQGELSLAGGGLVLASAGAKIRGGQTAYGVGTGFWLGDVSGVTKFSIGSSTKYLKWDGSALNIKGVVSLDALSVLNANLGNITAGNITLNSSGFIRTSGKDNYADTTAGFWLGYDSGYKLFIGDANNWLKWTGSALQIKGRLSVGTETNEDIYFEDSEIKLYDFEGGLGIGYKGIALKYSTNQFFDVNWKFETGVKVGLTLETGNKITWGKVGTAGLIESIDSENTVRLKFYTGGATNDFKLYGTGQLQLPNLSSNPTSNNAVGQLCSVSGVLKYYNGSAWKTVTVT